MINHCDQTLWLTTVINHCDQRLWPTTVINRCHRPLEINHCDQPLWSAVVINIVISHSDQPLWSTVAINHVRSMPQKLQVLSVLLTCPCRGMLDVLDASAGYSLQLVAWGAVVCRALRLSTSIWLAGLFLLFTLYFIDNTLWCCITCQLVDSLPPSILCSTLHIWVRKSVSTCAIGREPCRWRVHYCHINMRKYVKGMLRQGFTYIFRGSSQWLSSTITRLPPNEKCTPMNNPIAPGIQRITL